MSWETIVSVLSLGVGILGILLFVKSRKVKAPVWYIETTNLIMQKTAQFKDLEFRFKGHPVDNLSVSKIFFWNMGRETIDRKDITEADPICIIAPDFEILDSQLIATSNIANECSLLMRPKTGHKLEVSFEYLDRNQGAQFKIVHTGTSSNDIKLTGTIKGVSQIKQLESIGSRFTEDFWAAFVSGVALLALGVIGLFFEKFTFFGLIPFIIPFVMGGFMMFLAAQDAASIKKVPMDIFSPK